MSTAHLVISGSGVKGDKPVSPTEIRNLASKLGVRLELEKHEGDIVILAYELQSGVQLRDLPRMAEAGYWPSWADSLYGLKVLESAYRVQ